MSLAAEPRTKSWSDPVTGRTLTQVGQDLHVGYFRYSKHLPDGRVVLGSTGARRGKRRGDPSAGLVAVDPATGDVEPLDQPCAAYLRIRPTDGRTWYLDASRGVWELWEVDLPYGTPRRVCELPGNVPGVVVDITCDGKTLIYEYRVNEEGAFPIPTTQSPADLNRYLTRRRFGAIYAYDIEARRAGRLVEMAHVSPSHSDPSPTDPTLLRFTEDVLECTGQRMFSVRTDGGDRRPLRVQEFGEMITHEFWWADPNYVGYTYIDRRGDDTIYTNPWCEYATQTSHLGICDLSGHEVYRSDPLNSYHAHLYMSPRGEVVCGEGTAWNNFICAGLFDMKDTRLDLKPLAAIQTPWVPTRGSGTNCAFSNDGRWLLYNDVVDGRRQVIRVKVDI